MKILKRIMAGLASGIVIVGSINVQAESNISVLPLINPDIMEDSVNDVSDVIMTITDNIDIQPEKTESSYVYAQEPESYTQVYYSEPVYEDQPLTLTYDEFMSMYGDQLTAEETESVPIPADTNSEQVAYDQALANYNMALAEYEAASKMVETIKEVEVEIVEEVTDEEGNVSEVTRTEIQTVTEMVPAGDLASAQLKLDAARAALNSASQALEAAKAQTVIVEQPKVEESAPIPSTIVEPETEQQAIIEDDVEVKEEVTQAKSGKCGDSLTWTLDDNGLLTISGTGDMYDFLGPTETPPEEDFPIVLYNQPWRYCRITKVVIFNGVTGIGGNAFEDCINLKSITIPKSVVGIFTDMLSCNDLTDVYYEGTTYEWNSISKGDDCFPSRCLIHCLNDYGDGGVNIRIKNGYAYVSNIDEYFALTSYRYYHDLAKYAGTLSTLAYCDDKMDIVRGLKTLGYTRIANNFNYTRDDENYAGDISPVTFGLRYIKNIDVTVIAVIVEGTCKKEWLTNFDVGSGLIHDSFSNAAKHIYRSLHYYINGQESHIKGTMKILVTGHSRGAATANLLAAYLDNPSILLGDNWSKIIDRRNVYAYTFATPNTARRLDRDDEIYQNIFNIVNPEDFVTKVVPSYWGYGRFGHTFVLPTKQTLTTSEYKQYLTSVKNYYKNFNSTANYDPYPSGMEDLSKYVSYITSEVMTIEEYYNKSIGIVGSLYSLFKWGLGGLLCENSEYEKNAEIHIANAAVGNYGPIGAKTITFFVGAELLGRKLPENFHVNQYFSRAHESESYLAMLNSISGIEGFRNEKMYGIVNCPVDVTVYNSSGAIVGQIINNQVQAGNEIWMDVDGDSKIYSLPTGDSYRVELSGNDAGTMDYSYISEDVDRNNQIRAYHEGLELDAEKTYTTNDTSTYAVLTSDKTEIEPTAEFNSETSKQLKVDITVVGRGNAPSLSNLTPGDYVTLKAVTDVNNEFYGWYDSDGNLISLDEEYSFSIHEDVAFIATFSDIFVPIESITFKESSITLYPGQRYYNELIVGPDNYSSQTILWTTSDENIVVLDNGVLHAINPGCAVITAMLEDGNLSSQFAVNVKEKPVKSIQYELTLQEDIGVNVDIEFSDVFLTEEEGVIEFETQDYLRSYNIQNGTSTGNRTMYRFDSPYLDMNSDIVVNILTSEGISIYREVFNLKDYCEKYNVSFGECGDAQKWYSENDTLVIFGIGSMTNYTESTCPWGSSITSVNIKENITSIGDYAFYNSSLKDINIPSTVMKIGKYAFSNCDNLRDVYYLSTEKDWNSKNLYTFNDGVTIHFIDDIPFTDVPKDAWYYDVAKECYETGLINGTSETTFSPMQTMTRAMVVTILWRMDGQQKTTFNDKFKDVSSTQWYATSISWAVNNGVVNGYGDGTFKPDAAVTREQIAVMLANYTGYKKVYKPGTKKLNTYPDGSQVSTWAQQGMKWAISNGIISGNGEGYLRPKKSATRAEGAAMLLRMNNWL